MRMPSLLWLSLALLLAACQSGPKPPTPKMKIGKPYEVMGQTYTPAYEPTYDKTGLASWYGPGFNGKRTASGEFFDQNQLTAAHPTLPMPSIVRVTNLENGKSVLVRINDRGPFKSGRIIDLSKKAAQTIGFNGLAQVRVQYLEKETNAYLGKVEVVEEEDDKGLPPARDEGKAPTVSSAPTMAVTVGSSDLAPPIGIRSSEPIEKPVEVTDSIMPSGLPPVASMNAPKPQDKPAAKPAAKTSTKAAIKGKYYIQAGTFSSKDNATKLSKKLSGATVEKIQRGGKTLWRVRTGPYASRAQADTSLTKIRSLGATDARVVE